MPIKVDFSKAGEGDSDFTPLPAGEYNATVFEINSKIGKDSGQPYLEWIYQVTSEGYVNRRLWQIFSLQPQALWNLKSHLLALGLSEEVLAGEFDFEPRMFLGKPVELIVSLSTYQGKPGNDVESVRLLSQGNKPGASTKRAAKF